MAIQWYPGHMHATQKAIAKRLPDIDVVVELLDARLPGSSQNPLLAEMARGKPALKVLNKQDLADPELTTQWLTALHAVPGTRALALDAVVAAPARELVAACRALAPARGGMVKPVRVLICGIPNVGKSTLINTMNGQRVARTGDEPGITKLEQKIMLASDFQLFDTPGMLWPRISVERSGLHLAASGGIGRNAYDEEEVALALLAGIRPRYLERLRARYRLAVDDTGLSAAGPEAAGHADEALLAALGRARGGLLRGGQVNLQKAAEIAINDFRSGAWGRITLETPDEFARWCAEAREADAARQALREARQGARRRSRPGEPTAAPDPGSVPDPGPDAKRR